MIEEKKHSTLGASTAKRWLNCSGSVALIKQAPPARESKYAAEGTLAHSWLEWVLLTEVLGQQGVSNPKGVSLDMENHVQTAVNWVEENFNPKAGDELLVESRADLSFIDEEMFGTNDVAIVRLFGRLSVVDYKHGAGVAVEIEDDKGNPNEQLMYYALGVAHAYDYNFDEIEIVIIQPRAPHPDGPIRSKIISMKDLKTFEYCLRKGVERVRHGKTRLSAGSWCQFCPATAICPQLGKKATEAAASVFDDEIDLSAQDTRLPALPHPKDLSPEHIGRILVNADLLETWIKALREYAQGLLERGGRVEGFKLVMKKPRRQWNDEAGVARHVYGTIGMVGFDLKSPAQIEKLIPMGPEWVKKNATAISSGLTMTDESDPRPAMDKIKHVFNDEQGENGEKESDEKEGDQEKVPVQKAPCKKSRRKKSGDDFDLGF